MPEESGFTEPDVQPPQQPMFTCACCSRAYDVKMCACYTSTGGCMCANCAALSRAGACCT